MDRRGAARLGWLELAAAAALSAAFLAYFQFQHPWLPDTDAHYHLRAAWLMRTQGLFHGFKWASWSMWRDDYSDTCLLFHLYLIPFTFLPDLQLAGKLATVLLGAACFASFYAILRLNRVRGAGLWLMVLAISGPCFLWRINVPRPQVLSVLLLLWFIHFLINERLRAAVAVCFLYPFAYAAAFLPLIFLGVRSAHLAVWEERLDWRTPAAGLAACALGLVLNPYFPHDLTMLYVQNFYVMGVNLFSRDRLHMGRELDPLDTRNILASHVPVVLAWLGVSQLGAALGRKAGRRTQLLFAFALTAVLMTFVSERFVEYSVPLLLLYCAFRAEEALAGADVGGYLRRRPGRLKAALAGLALFYAVGGAASTWATRRAFRNTSEALLKGSALWLKAHAARDEQVFTCDWGDAPQLFFFDQDQRYLVFMDPAFMHYWSRDSWRVWTDLSAARLGRSTYLVLRDTFRVRYGVCEERYQALHGLIDADPRMKVVYDDGKGYVFELEPPEQASARAGGGRTTL